MRRALDRLYDGCAALAACFMVGLLVAVLLSVIGRQANFNIPGIDAYAGYLMAGAGFLALAHTLKRGEHIRVTLLLNFLKGGAKKGFEIWALAIATLLGVAYAKAAVPAELADYHGTPMDQYFEQQGTQTGKKIVALESIDEQSTLLFNHFSLEVQASILSEMLEKKDQGNIPKRLKTIEESIGPNAA